MLKGNFMKIALAQINTTVGDLAGNGRKIVDFYRRAVQQGAEMVVFPELCMTGYPPRDLLLRRQFISDNLAALQTVASQTGEVPALVGFVDTVSAPSGSNIANAAALLRGGRVAEKIHKTLLPTYDVFDEDRYFRAGEKNSPILVGGLKIGVTICEDIWNDADFWPKRFYDRDPVAELRREGAQMIVNLSASPWNLGKLKIRRDMMRTISQKDRLPVAYCNAVGGNDELIFDGSSIVFNASGELVAFGKRFEEDLILVDAATAKPAPFTEMADVEKLFRALTLGLKDYVVKCGFQSVVLGLSGGIDSAVAAALAAHALGPQNVMGVAMPSKYSSDHSVKDAQELAKNLGIRFEIVPIQEPVDAVYGFLKAIFAGRPEDATEENIQSRMRGLILMAISNKLGSLLLTTGNKSELATGYCTLYGDMCGGLAVISDVPKMMVYELASFINRGSELIPKNSIAKPPSAELKPNQTDQDTLPPYRVLDKVLKAYVEDHRPVQDIVGDGLTRELVADLVRKIDHNEYKRRQAAPGLKVTSTAFGIGRRMPIAQKYREEKGS